MEGEDDANDEEDKIEENDEMKRFWIPKRLMTISSWILAYPMGYVAFVLCSPFGENVTLEWALISQLDRDPPSAKNQKMNVCKLMKQSKRSLHLSIVVTRITGCPKWKN